jgi:hypothetical protein
MLENHWLAADALAARLGLAQRVRDSVEQTFERWDGSAADGAVWAGLLLRPGRGSDEVLAEAGERGLGLG